MMRQPYLTGTTTHARKEGSLTVQLLRNTLGHMCAAISAAFPAMAEITKSMSSVLRFSTTFWTTWLP